jgi:hypothetical protein
MILVKQNIVQLSLIDHFSALAFVEVLFLRFTQLVRVSGISQSAEWQHIGN